MWMPSRNVLRAYKWRAWTYSKINNHKLALADFTQVLALDSKDNYSLRERARAFYHLGGYERSTTDPSSYPCRSQRRCSLLVARSI
jgi:regulator of sirC expression with transglutaminase-like and TPR domain